ncbi:MAG: hypothetical protein ACM31C_11985 [Acidobacteriota bacterium]
MAVILSLFVAACDVGSAITNGQQPDSGMGSGKMDGSGSNVTMAHTHAAPVNANNPTNAGLGCMSVNCHSATTPGTGATPYTFAGTVFTGPAASMGNPNITVRVGALTAVTDAAGNFYSTSAVTFPQNTGAGSSNMQGQISVGDCNSSGCHQFPGGAQTPINTMN